jgi:hypothetical protein
MNVRKKIMSAIVVSYILAFWHLYGQVWYQSYLEVQGKTMGINEIAFGYLILFIISWIIVKILIGGDGDG